MRETITYPDFKLPFRSELSMQVLKEAFAKNCFVKLPAFFEETTFSNLLEETSMLLELQAKRKDFNMVETNGTPRHLTTVSGQKIGQYAPLISRFFTDEKLLSFLSQIAKEPVHLVPDLDERHAIHRQHRRGDIHGGHVDDYAFVLVTCLESPGRYQGGEIEYVPHSTDINDLGTEKAKTDILETGDAYFMRSNSAVHRVLPLKTNVNRTVIVCSYANPETKDIKLAYSSDRLYD